MPWTGPGKHPGGRGKKGITRYVCGECGKIFPSRRVDCIRHMREQHGMVDPIPVAYKEGTDYGWKPLL